MPANPNDQTDNTQDTPPGLIFDRFLGPGRLGMQDVDLNFERGHRSSTVDWLRQRFPNTRNERA